MLLAHHHQVIPGQIWLPVSSVTSLPILLGVLGIFLVHTRSGRRRPGYTWTVSFGCQWSPWLVASSWGWRREWTSARNLSVGNVRMLVPAWAVHSMGVRMWFMLCVAMMVAGRWMRIAWMQGVLGIGEVVCLGQHLAVHHPRGP